MLDSLKNAFLAGVGMVSMTHEKLKAVLDDLVKRGEVTAEQGKKIFEEMVTRGQTEGRSLSEKVAEDLARMAEKTPFATRRELKRLEERLSALETASGQAAPAPGVASSGGCCGGAGE